MLFLLITTMFRHFLRLVSFIPFLLLTGIVYAQDENSADGFGVESNFLVAKVIKHTVKFTAPIPAITTALDANFVWQTS